MTPLQPTTGFYLRSSPLFYSPSIRQLCVARAISIRFTAGLLQQIGFLGVYLMQRKILKNYENYMVAVRNTPTWKPQLIPHRRSVNNIINMQTIAPLTTPHKSFFQIRNGPGSSKNLRRMRRRRTGYVVALRILRILVYKALQRTSGWKNIKVNIQPWLVKSYLLLSLYWEIGRAHV